MLQSRTISLSHPPDSRSPSSLLLHFLGMLVPALLPLCHCQLVQLIRFTGQCSKQEPSGIYNFLVILIVIVIVEVQIQLLQNILIEFHFLCWKRWNLTANAARPNPQGSYHYGTIPIQRTLILANSETKINGSLRYAVNSVSYVNPATPLKLADYYNISGVFKSNSIKDFPLSVPAVFGTSVIGTTLHDFIEIVFQNNETTIQSWHLDGYSFWTVG